MHLLIQRFSVPLAHSKIHTVGSDIDHRLIIDFYGFSSSISPTSDIHSGATVTIDTATVIGGGGFTPVSNYLLPTPTTTTTTTTESLFIMDDGHCALEQIG